jgi:hypothetical protein
MFQKRFKIDPDTLRYVQVKRDLKSRILTGLFFSLATILLTAGIISITDNLDVRMKYRHLKKVNSRLVEQYRQLSTTMDNYDRMLAEYQVTDDSIYRCILDIEPIPAYSRKPGFGGSDRFEYLEGFPSSPIMISTSLRLDLIEIKTNIQYSSFSDLDNLATKRKSLLGSLPAIQPVAIDATYWLSSDFGYRIDPFTHMRAFHSGLDFASEPGLNIYATGDGIVDFTGDSRWGYGKEILIDHGFGYTSRYAHLQNILVQPGQEVKRGQLIGLLGNSGRSTGPHLHYGVNYYDKDVNPYFYFSNDLSPQEYHKIVSLSE